MENTQTQNAKENLMKSAHGIEARLVPFFAQFPHIPEGGRKVIADISPWIALVFGIISLLVLLGGGLMGTIFAMPMILSNGVWAIISFLGLLLSLVVTILQLFAVTPLKARMKKGWNYIFYGMLIAALSTLLSVAGYATNSLGHMGGFGVLPSLVSGAVSFLITGWILFEIRDQYKA